NPLVAIKTFAQLLPERFDDPEFRKNFNQIVVQEIDRLDKIITQINAFAHPAELKMRPLDIRTPLKRGLELARSKFRVNGGVAAAAPCSLRCRTTATGLRRKCARRSSLLSVRQKRAAWDWVCRSSNGPCSITTVALTSIPARAALLLASRYPRPRMATRPRWRAPRRWRPIFGTRQRASLPTYLASAFCSKGVRRYVRLNSANSPLYW